MDGGRRVLRSLTEPFRALSAAAYPHPRGFASASAHYGAAPFDAYPSASAPAAARPRIAKLGRNGGKASRRSAWSRLAVLLARPGVGSVAVALLFAVVGWTGFVQGGGYAELVEREGAPYDIIARAIGFEISAVTISGQTEVAESQVLAAAGVSPRNSLAFLDAAEVRRKVMELPLVKSARVLKLYPDRLVIAIEERQPYALWQQEGTIHIIDSEGKVIDDLRDEKFLTLPFVVGEGAQIRVAEYNSLLSGLGDLASRVKAGVYVAGRRWTLDMKNGVQVKLPEQGAGEAVATLARLQHDVRILDKDILTVDLRTPGRIAVRVTDEGVAARAALQSRKPVKSGSHT
jgi:cell division protein FtsQ